MASPDGKQSDSAEHPAPGAERAASGAHLATRCTGTVIASGERCDHRPHRCAGCGRVGCNRPERHGCTAQQFAFLTCVSCERFAEILPPE